MSDGTLIMYLGYINDVSPILVVYFGRSRSYNKILTFDVSMDIWLLRIQGMFSFTRKNDIGNLAKNKLICNIFKPTQGYNIYLNSFEKEWDQNQSDNVWFILNHSYQMWAFTNHTEKSEIISKPGHYATIFEIFVP